MFGDVNEREGTMRFNDSDYHARREGEHRALAEAAITAEAKRAHLGMADQHAARTRSTGSLPGEGQRRRATGR